MYCINWKAVEQSFTVVLFIFPFYPVSNFGKFTSFGLDTVGSERVNEEVYCSGKALKLFLALVVLAV